VGGAATRDRPSNLAGAVTVRDLTGSRHRTGRIIR
jgi:hypothetical protein